MATAQADAGRTTTPSPEGTYGDSIMGGNSSEVPSPLPASTSSTTTCGSESHSHHHSGQSYSVPNPFAAGAPAPPHSGWGSHAYETGANPAVPSYAPHHHPHHHPGPIPMVVSAPRAPAPAPQTAYHHPQAQPWSRENSCPNFAIGTTDGNEPKSPRTAKGGARRRSYTKGTTTATKADTGTSGGSVNDNVNSRRQKRLERNRESARLSRRRRKQYLEILEERVTQLSMELDAGRRAHASQAVTIIQHKRREVLEIPDKTDEERMRLLEFGLGRTSPEMMLVATFLHQQLKSFSLPPQSKFVLWLTLQNDQYFRGGRAASERLSAARIGERMLNSGNDRVPPAQSMWPLFCNEVGLSYDQEERVRNFQRTLLQSHDSWLQRHSARASDLAMTAVHDSTQAMTLRLGQRERSMMSILNPAQKVKFLAFAEKKREKMKQVMQAKVTKHMASTKNQFVDDRFKTDKNQHVAANLYVLSHRLQKVMQVMPRAAPLVTGATLKKLSRRPSFESLGRMPLDKNGKDGDDEMSRDTSFASSGSLKRSGSVLSMDGDRPQLLQISPDDAEETCKPTVEKVLGYLREIIPPTPPIQYSGPPQDQVHQQQVVEFRIPSPAHVTSAPSYQHTLQPQYVQAPMPQAQAQAPVPMSIVSAHASAPELAGRGHGHQRKSSFIPPYLNVVPEEMFPNDGTADEFLMSLVDEDWAIGEGIDMDTSG